MWPRKLRTVTGTLAFAAMLPLVNAGYGQQSGGDLQAIPDQAVRRWTDAAGERAAAARLLAADGQKARLEKSSGKVVTVALESLSPADRQLIRSRLAAVNAAERPKTAGPSLTELVGGPVLAAVPSCWTACRLRYRRMPFMSASRSRFSTATSSIVFSSARR